MGRAIIREAGYGVKLDFLAVLRAGRYDELRGFSVFPILPVSPVCLDVLRSAIRDRFLHSPGVARGHTGCGVRHAAATAAGEPGPSGGRATRRHPPLDTPAKAAAAVLAEPLDYPPLARGVTPSDRVVLALEEGVPQAGEVVAAAI